MVFFVPFLAAYSRPSANCVIYHLLSPAHFASPPAHFHFIAWLISSSCFSSNCSFSSPSSGIETPFTFVCVTQNSFTSLSLCDASPNSCSGCTLQFIGYKGLSSSSFPLYLDSWESSRAVFILHTNALILRSSWAQHGAWPIVGEVAVCLWSPGESTAAHIGELCACIRSNKRILISGDGPKTKSQTRSSPNSGEVWSQISACNLDPVVLMTLFSVSTLPPGLLLL